MARKARRRGHGLEFSVQVDGMRQSKTFHDRRAGELWVLEIKAKASRGQVGLPADATLAEAFERFYRDRSPSLAPSTRALYQVYWRKHLAPLGSRLLSSIRPGELQSWVASLQRSGQATASVHRLIGLLKALWAHAETAGLAAGNPCRTLRLPKVQKVRDVRMLAEKDLDAVLAACSTPRLRALVQVAVGTGLRLGELMAMRWEWIDWPREVIRVPASIEAGFIPKGKRERDVPLLPDVAAALKEWRAHATGEDRVFSGVNWRRWAASLRKRSGVPFRWHLLRHTYLSRLVMAGVPLRLVQAVAGHASIRTTEVYSHLSPGALDEIRSRFSCGMAAERRKVIPLEASRRAAKRQ